MNNDRSYVIRKDKFITKLPVKDEIKLMLFMLPGYPAHGFVSKPSDPFQFVL
jgi:hypothetical protein